MIQLKKIVLIIIFLFSAPMFPQAFGFGCFGFVGGYAGYSYQKYEPGSLNTAVHNFNSVISSGTVKIISDFGSAQGYRVGINFFRAQFSDVFVSLKGYYESLNENQNFSYTLNNERISSELDFILNSWNVGVDFGIPINNRLNWKIIESTIHFNNARFTNKRDLSLSENDIKYKNDAPEIGYSLSTGFVFSVVENFVSLEGSAGYQFFKIKKMTAEDGSGFYLGPDKNYIPEGDFIKAGGFNAVVQLNVGFPL
jgi:hypothetical protein